MEMLNEYGIESGNEALKNESETYMNLKKQIYFMKLSAIPYRVRYPEEWSLPRPYDPHWQQILMKRIQNVPYKRISHFREHLNRLQFTQMIDIPQNVINIVRRSLEEHNGPSWEVYTKVKQNLKKEKLTRYNEHIHYMTSLITQEFIQIEYTDHHDMFQLFLELEQQFCKEQRYKQARRKNMISYYLIIQLVLYLFHYHPNYKLPSIRDPKKREILYCELLTLFTKTQSYQQIITLHFKRKKDCYYCHVKEHVHHFDEHIIKVL